MLLFPLILMYFAVAHGGNHKRNEGKQLAIQSNDVPIGIGEPLENPPGKIEILAMGNPDSSNGKTRGEVSTIDGPNPNEGEPRLSMRPAQKRETGKAILPPALGPRVHHTATSLRLSSVVEKRSQQMIDSWKKTSKAQESVAKPSNVDMPSSFLFAGRSRPT